MRLFRLFVMGVWSVDCRLDAEMRVWCLLHWEDVHGAVLCCSRALSRFFFCCFYSWTLGRGTKIELICTYGLCASLSDMQKCWLGFDGRRLVCASCKLHQPYLISLAFGNGSRSGMSAPAAIQDMDWVMCCVQVFYY